MSEFSVCSLYSGSGGNATWIRADQTELLIDAGVSAAALERGLKEIGTSPDRLGAILITHEHIDHVKGLEVFSKKHRIPVHLTEISAAHMTVGVHLRPCLTLHTPHDEIDIGPLHIRSFPVPHDSACCVGYRIEYGDRAIAIATDMGRVTTEILDAFLGAEGVIVESNHDIDLLLANPHYPPALKQRILSGSGHLSNDFCARFLNYLAAHGTRHALLAHLSPENNTPDLALSTLRARLTAPLDVRIAAPAAITRLL